MEPLFLGQISIFGGNYAPRGWALCDGQLLPIPGNEALFSLLGTTYGGDGRTTFALPDLRGRVPISVGKGTGLSENYRLGQWAGYESNRLISSQLPQHNHSFSGTINASSEDGTTSAPTGKYLAKGEKVLSRTETEEYPVYSDSKDTNTANDSVEGTTSPTGNNNPVNNMQPYLAVNFIIAITGVYPSRN